MIRSQMVLQIPWKEKLGVGKQKNSQAEKLLDFDETSFYYNEIHLGGELGSFGNRIHFIGKEGTHEKKER